MKITINGSPKELAELLDALGGIETEAKKEELPPLLTKLAEDEKLDKLTEAIRNADKENAPQAEAAEQKTNQEIIEKQMKLLSEASEFCAGDLRFPQNLSQLTRAMIDLHKYQGRLS